MFRTSCFRSASRSSEKLSLSTEALTGPPSFMPSNSRTSRLEIRPSHSPRRPPRLLSIRDHFISPIARHPVQSPLNQAFSICRSKLQSGRNRKLSPPNSQLFNKSNPFPLTLNSSSLMLLRKTFTKKLKLIVKAQKGTTDAPSSASAKVVRKEWGRRTENPRLSASKTGSESPYRRPR